MKKNKESPETIVLHVKSRFEEDIHRRFGVPVSDGEAIVNDVAASVVEELETSTEEEEEDKEAEELQEEEAMMCSGRDADDCFVDSDLDN